MTNNTKLTVALYEQAKALCATGPAIAKAVRNKYSIASPIYVMSTILDNNCSLLEKELSLKLNARVSVLHDGALGAQNAIQVIYAYVAHGALGLPATIIHT
jgi:carbohydrate-selective porin OprB